MTRAVDVVTLSRNAISNITERRQRRVHPVLRGASFAWTPSARSAASGAWVVRLAFKLYCTPPRGRLGNSKRVARSSYASCHHGALAEFDRLSMLCDTRAPAFVPVVTQSLGNTVTQCACMQGCAGHIDIRTSPAGPPRGASRRIAPRQRHSNDWECLRLLAGPGRP